MILGIILTILILLIIYYDPHIDIINLPLGGKKYIIWYNNIDNRQYIQFIIKDWKIYRVD